jgi:ketosteroid isomerase-like protein
MDHDKLADRFAVREVIELYTDAVTRRDWNAVGGLFAGDAVWAIGAPTNIELGGRAAIVEGLERLVAPFDVFVQMTHSIVIDLDGDRAGARTIVHGFGRARDRSRGAFALGVYTDTLFRDGRRWLFESRRFDPVYIDDSVPPGEAYGPFAGG